MVLTVWTCSGAYELTVRQHPERARVAGGKEKGKLIFCLCPSEKARARISLMLWLERKPVDPPPIIQLRIRDENDPAQ